MKLNTFRFSVPTVTDNLMNQQCSHAASAKRGKMRESKLTREIFLANLEA